MMDENEPHAIFEYLYRDAGNYKAFGALLLKGECSEDEVRAITSSCESKLSFVAEHVGIPALYHELYAYSGGPTVDDHVFHEFGALRKARPEEVKGEPWGTVAELTRRFVDIGGKWRYELSPHWDAGWR